MYVVLPAPIVMAPVFDILTRLSGKYFSMNIQISNFMGIND